MFLIGTILSYSQETQITRISPNSCTNQRTIYLAENAEADYFERTVFSQGSEFQKAFGEVDTLAQNTIQ